MSDTAPFGRGRIRRVFGLDRSGPEPSATRRGQPLRPFTLPNFVGLLRIIGIGGFLILASSTGTPGEGVSIWAALIFWMVAAGDYLDGLLARVTGQYSRLGAILDPVIDRATILSGVLVCWHFALLPRWMLAVLVARELVTLAMARWGLSHGLDIEVNWIGRMAVFPVMSAILFALVIPGWFPTVLLAIGILMAWAATAIYFRSGKEGIRALAEKSPTSTEG